MTNKQRILLIEDDSYLRDIYKLTLEEADFDTTVASDGREGLVKAQEGGYDLILLDVMMPYLNGNQVLEELKKEPPQKPNNKIILLTNLAHDEVINEALKLGAASYLVKSDLDPGTFLEKVTAALQA